MKKFFSGRIWLTISIMVLLLFAAARVTSKNTPDKPRAGTSIISSSPISSGAAGQKIAVGSRQKLDTSLGMRLLGFFGLFVLVFISWLMSVDRKHINWRPVIWGIVLQLIFGMIVLSETVGGFFFNFVNNTVMVLLSFSEEGAVFVFGKLAYGPGDPRGLQQGMFFFFSVLPTIIFFCSLMTVMYHLGIMQFVVEIIAKIMRKTMKTSGSETLSAAANIFVGQTEAPLVVKPFLQNMTTSELHAVMTGGFATVAGGVMAAYVMFLKDYIPNIAGHLVTASIMSAPAALAISKIVFPETKHSETAGDMKITVEKKDSNVIEAASRGASEGMMLLLNVAGMLIAFVAMVAMINFGLEKFSDVSSRILGRNPYRIILPEANVSKIQEGDVLVINKNGKVFEYSVAKVKKDSVIVDKRMRVSFKNQDYTVLRGGKKILSGSGLSGFCPVFFINLSILFGLLFAPVSWTMGVPWREATVVGRLLGEKLVLTEFVAYINLAGILQNGYETVSGAIIHLSQRSAVIVSYALCGFANFASIGIQIGGIGSLAPNKRATLAKIGMRAMFAGAIAACMTGTVAGILL